MATSLDTSSKGFKMMAKLGYKPGSTLGKSEDARKEPIAVSIKENRGGIGHDTEKKRKILEEFEEAAKRVKVEEVGYRDRVRQEREEKRLSGLIIGAQKVVERLETETYEEAERLERETAETVVPSKRPLSKINVLWRGLVRERLEKEAEKRMRADMQQSLSRLPTYDDPEDDEEDERAFAKKQSTNEFVEEDLYVDDAELDDFQALPAEERLEKLVLYLRDTFHYCFWCKYKYEDAEMKGCPGLTEDEHG